MKIVIIEDEAIGARRLERMIHDIDPTIEVIAVLESMMEAKEWLNAHQPEEVDLFLSDIQLSDGLAFDIFEHYDAPLPIIFTTAYDEYALRAFKLNGIDYLLKPIQEGELRAAIEKYKKTKATYVQFQVDQLMRMLEHVQQVQSSWPTFLSYRKDKMIPVSSERVAYFVINQGIVFAITDEDQYMLEEHLDDIASKLPDAAFFRINRQCIVQRQFILNASLYSGYRLQLSLTIPTSEELIVSREKVCAFKQWLVQDNPQQGRRSKIR